MLRKDLPPNDDAAVFDEVSILTSLRHRYICPLIDFFDEKECYFLVMELMAGGDLFDRIGHKKSYDEKDARDLCRKMLEAVKFIHENCVAHCDMKPKNLLLGVSFFYLVYFGDVERQGRLGYGGRLSRVCTQFGPLEVDAMLCQDISLIPPLLLFLAHGAVCPPFPTLSVTSFYNTECQSEEDDSFIKLADFGFATRVYGPGTLTKQCGTPFFVGK